MKKFFEIISFIKDIVSDENKIAKFKEVVSGIKELVSDIKDVVGFLKREDV